jgi:hypothetical protein
MENNFLQKSGLLLLITLYGLGPYFESLNHIFTFGVKLFVKVITLQLVDFWPILIFLILLGSHLLSVFAWLLPPTITCG